MTYTFTLGTGCVDSSSRIVTVVDPNPSDAGPDLEACIGSPTVVLNGLPAGGTWTGSFVTVGGVFNPSTSGVYELVYSTGVGNCLTTDTMEFTVHDLPIVDAGLDEVLCISEGAFDLVGNPLAGVWSGTGIVDANQGTFDPVVAMVGDHIVTYTYIDPITTCVNQDDLTVTVNPLPVVDFTVDSIICINTSVDFTNNSTLAAQSDWSFGDGNTSNQFAPSHTYTSTGLFDITLVVTTVNGCVDSASTTVSVLDFPNAQFSVTPDTACGPLTASFTNNSTGIATTFQWDFGDGTASSDENPANVVYNQAVYTDTNYIIVLEVSNYCGTDTHIDTITVLPSPTAIIGTDFNSGCTPWDVTIANASIGYPESYQWDFGDGTTSTISDTLFQHTYTTGQTPTDYTIQLIATNGCGSDTTEYTITALPNDVDAFFNTSTTEGCAPVTVNFTQYTLGGTSYSWDFDDGNFSNVYSPTHTFVNPGTYNVSLFANDGCGFDTTTVTITVHPYPDMAFTSTPNSVCVFVPFDFTNQSTGITGVSWDFGDGNTSNLVNPSHAYALPGTYTVTLTGTSSVFGCVASFSQDVIVSPPPIAQFTADPTNSCIPLIVQTTNTSVDAVFYHWDFGDGNTSNQVNPNHTYVAAGTYTIQLIVESANGCTDTMAMNVTAHPFPVADFDLASALNCIPDGQASFINQSTGAIGYEWDFGNGQTSVLTNPSINYTTAGTYNVTLTVSNQYGCEDVAEQQLTFHNYAEADYAIPSYVTCEGNALTFNSTSLNTNSVEWLFGNSESFTGNNIDYTYPNAGNYTVTMIAYGNGGCNDTLTIPIPATIFPTPIADFNYENVIEINANTGTIDFTNLSSLADTYFWDLGDGSTSTLVNPTHHYGTHGFYDVTLIAYNNFGCSDTITKPIEVDFYKGLFLANAMYPNHTDFNVSHFVPVGVGLKEFELLIYDDWGNLIWSTTAIDSNGRPTEAWDGTFMGEPVQQDAYVWKVTASFLDDSVWEGKAYPKNVLKKSGTVTVIR